MQVFLVDLDRDFGCPSLRAKILHLGNPAVGALLPGGSHSLNRSMPRRVITEEGYLVAYFGGCGRPFGIGQLVEPTRRRALRSP